MNRDRRPVRSEHRFVRAVMMLRSSARLVVVAVLAVTVGLTAAAANPAAAQSGRVAAAGQPGGWERVVAAPFTSPAGDLCPFELRSEPLFDQVYVRTTARFADGSPRRQEYAGPLVVRLTNTATGTSIVRDLSGRAVARYRPDGGYTFRIQGPAAVGFRAYRGDNLATGYYVLRGDHTVRFAAADGPRTLIRDRGSEENVCRTLRATT